MTKKIVSQCPCCSDGNWEIEKIDNLNYNGGLNIDFDDFHCWIIAICCECGQRFEMKFVLESIKED